MEKKIIENKTNKESTLNKRVVVKKQKRKKQKKMQRIVFVLCIILIVGILGVSNIDTILRWVGLGSIDSFQGDLSGNRKFQKLSIKETLYDNLSTDINFSDQKVINILIFGVDQSTDRESEYSIFRPDTIILASINLETKSIQLVSVPRDSYVPIYGADVKDKINACFMYGAIDKDTSEEEFQGGVECLEKTVSQLLGGVPINYYVGINMDGVPKVIDTIGGVKVDVPEDIYQYHSDKIFMEKGEHILNGQEFLYYARYRDYVMGDFRRMETQQMLLKCLFTQLTSSESIMKLPKAISQTFEIVMTDISFKQMTTLAFTLKDFSINNIKTATVPSFSKTFSNNLSYVVIDQAERVKFVKEYFGISISAGYQD